MTVRTAVVEIRKYEHGPLLATGAAVGAGLALLLLRLMLLLQLQVLVRVCMSLAVQPLQKCCYCCCSLWDCRHLEREGDLQQFELALLVNLLPRTPDEAKAHIPSLIRLSPARLSRIIDTLEVFRVHAS